MLLLLIHWLSVPSHCSSSIQPPGATAALSLWTPAERSGRQMWASLRVLSLTQIFWSLLVFVPFDLTWLHNPSIFLNQLKILKRWNSGCTSSLSFLLLISSVPNLFLFFWTSAERIIKSEECWHCLDVSQWAERRHPKQQAPRGWANRRMWRLWVYMVYKSAGTGVTPEGYWLDLMEARQLANVGVWQNWKKKGNPAFPAPGCT